MKKVNLSAEFKQLSRDQQKRIKGGINGAFANCGTQGGGATCPNNECCSIWGFCGTGVMYCCPPNCQSQCHC